MAEKVTIEVDAEVKKALDNLEKIKEKIDEISDDTKEVGESSKKAAQGTKSLEGGFKGVGLAMKAAGFALITKIVNSLFEAMMKNQQIADAVSTAFNVVGVVFGKITDTLVNIVNFVGKSSDNFDALGRIVKNVVTLAIEPLKIAFNLIILAIKDAQLTWEKSWLGGKDLGKIKKLTEELAVTKKSIEDSAKAMSDAGKGIITDFKEGVNEIHNIGKATVTEFTNTFKDVTVKTVLEQAEAVTKATTNLGLLQAKHREVIIEFEKQAEEQRAIRDDISQSIDDRIEANEKLKVIAQQQLEAELEAIKAQQGALRQRMAVEVDNADLKAQIAELDNAALETEHRRTQLEKESTEQSNALLQERIDNELELQKIGEDIIAKEKLEIEGERARLMRLAEVTISVEEEKNAKLEQIKNEFDARIKTIDDGVRAAKEAADAEELRKEQALQDNKRAIIGSALSGITALIGQETMAGKALAIAQATMDTYAGATKALAQGGLYGTIGAVGVIAQGLASVKQIIGTKVPGQSGGGATPPSPSTAEAPPVPTFGAIEAEAPPVQAFVVESDVSSSQALQNDLDLQATL